MICVACGQLVSPPVIGKPTDVRFDPVTGAMTQISLAMACQNCSAVYALSDAAFSGGNLVLGTVTPYTPPVPAEAPAPDTSQQDQEPTS